MQQPLQNQNILNGIKKCGNLMTSRFLEVVCNILLQGVFCRWWLTSNQSYCHLRQTENVVSFLVRWAVRSVLDPQCILCGSVCVHGVFCRIWCNHYHSTVPKLEQIITADVECDAVVLEDVLVFFFKWLIMQQYYCALCLKKDQCGSSHRSDLLNTVWFK